MNIDEYRALRAQEATTESQTDQPESQIAQQDSVTIEQTPTQQAEEEALTSEVSSENAVIEEKKPQTPDKLLIDGEEVTLDDLREWRKSGLRTADYTRKTQELARKNKELEQASQLYDFFRQNPQAAQAALDAVPQSGSVLNQVDPVQQKIQELEQRYYDMVLEKEIETLQSKYPDFEVRDVLEIAQRERLTNLETAYKLSIVDKKPTPPPASQPINPSVDIDSLRKQIRMELAQELDKERKSTTSIISSNDSSTPPQNNTPTLTPEEDKVRRMMGISVEEWVKWR